MSASKHDALAFSHPSKTPAISRVTRPASTSAIAIPGPFAVSPTLIPTLPQPVNRALRFLAERALAFPTLNSIYESMHGHGDRSSFCEQTLRALGVRIDLAPDDLKRIPKDGPLIVVANHPFGGLDGLVLTALLQRVRPDVRVLANYLLSQVPELKQTCFFVDPFGGPAATVRNHGSMKFALRWVRDGGVLGLFPAGEVSAFSLRRGCVTDPQWSDSLARLVMHTKATVLPVYFEGRNSRLFQLAGLVHPRLRTALLPRELLRRRGQSVRVAIGTSIPFERLTRVVEIGAESRVSRGVSSQLTEYLRVRTYILKGRGASRSHAGLPSPGKAVEQRPIVSALPLAIVASEVESIPTAQQLCASGQFRVFHGSAAQLPNVLREIGRLRESTFRLVGEGTGREIDLDRFDEHYLHLFVWNTESRQIVGAYRMGQTDVLLKRFGADGLYTSTLFNYRPRLLEQLTPGLELGRSFVIPDYQRNFSPLLLLWKGIGRFVALHPRYRRLFGAVSISDDFQSMTKQLLMAFLKANSFDHELASLVRPKKPPKVQRFRDAEPRCLATMVNDVADVEELVSEIESNRRNVPVLLRQYLKLNAKLLGFNIDPDFGDVLDGLVMVDLAKVDRTILNRYLGMDNVAEFLAFQVD
ncbi:MAG: lysophospholipid acyltransferase family protein [Planctomycetes bacterium]|nr:lysophospholipid acyltransferase family protein [Planctomycetota bacterium]